MTKTILALTAALVALSVSAPAFATPKLPLTILQNANGGNGGNGNVAVGVLSGKGVFAGNGGKGGTNTITGAKKAPGGSSITQNANGGNGGNGNTAVGVGNGGKVGAGNGGNGGSNSISF